MAYLCIRNGRVECDCCGECRGGGEDGPVCPVCGSPEAREVYTLNGDIIGCDECLYIEIPCCPNCGSEKDALVYNADGIAVGCEGCVVKVFDWEA